MKIATKALRHQGTPRVYDAKKNLYLGVPWCLGALVAKISIVSGYKNRTKTNEMPKLKLSFF